MTLNQLAEILSILRKYYDEPAAHFLETNADGALVADCIDKVMSTDDFKILSAYNVLKQASGTWVIPAFT